MVLGAMTLITGIWAQAQSTYSNAIAALSPATYWPLNETTAPSGGLYAATNSGTLGAAGNGYYETWWQTNGVSNALVSSNSIFHIAGAIVGDSDTALQQGVIGQYVVIPRCTNGVANSAVTMTAPFTIEMWVYPTNNTSGQLKPILAEGFNNSQVTNLAYATMTQGTAIGMYSGFIYFNTYNGAGTKTEIDTVALTLNQWYHYAATFDGLTMTVYTNGVKCKSSNPAFANGTNYAFDAVSPLIIGGGNELGISGGANVLFGGGIDEVAIYTNALTVTQVANHYAYGTNSARTTSYASVVGADSPKIYLRLDEPAFAGAAAPSTYPIANNYGSLASAANGNYLPGATPGMAGPAYSGFGSPSYGVALNGFNAGVDVGGGSLPALLNPTAKQPLSVTVWFKGNPADCVGRFQTLVGHSDSSWRLNLDTLAGIQFNPGSGPQLQFSSLANELTNGMFVNDGNWHMAAGVSDGTNDFLYIDGLLAKTGTPVTNVPGKPFDVILGGDPQYLAPQSVANGAAGGRWFDGSLAQVAFFTNALTLSQIQGLYTAAGVPPSLWLQPQSTTNNAGVNVTIATGVHGSIPLSYQWYQNGLPVSGQTNASLAYAPSVVGNAGSYQLIVTNTFGAVTSSVVTLFLYGAPVIQQQTLADVRVFAGTSPKLQVTASGAPPIVYQWRSNGVAILNATNFAFIVTNAQVSATYTCDITNFVGVAAPAFNPVALTVLSDPTAPYPLTVLADKPAAYFRLDEASGTTAYDYSGGNNAVYTNVSLGLPGYNSLAAVPSDPAETAAGFGFNSPPNNYAGNVPAYLNFGATNGANAAFSVEAWVTQYLYSGGGDAIVALGYGNGGEQVLLDTGATATGYLRFLVRNAAGTAYSANSTNFLANDGLWHHVVGVCDEANGFIYLYKDGALVASATIPAGSGILASTTPLSIGARQSGNFAGTNYDYQLYGAVDDVAVYSTALSAAKIQTHYLQSGVSPVITGLQPSSNWATNQAANVVFTVSASGTAPLSYQWTDNDGNPIAWGTNATLIVTNVQPSQAGAYTVNVTNVYGGPVSTNVTLTVTQIPQILADITPSNLVVYATTPNTLTVGVSGTPPLHYQWYQDGVLIPNATNASYSFGALLGTNTYYLSVTNVYSAGSPTLSSTATVVGMPITTLAPADYTDHMRITFAGYNRSETLSDFPVLVRLSTNLSGFNYNHFADPMGGDLRFTDSGGVRVIPSEIDEWNTSGESTVWVQIPALSGTNSTIWAYWGNAVATTPPAGTNVWVPQPWEGLPAFDVVYHLKETGFPYADATGLSPALTGTKPTPVAGIVGTGESFASSYLDAGTINVGGTFTVSAWVDLSSTDNNIQSIWASKAGSSSSGFALYVNFYNTADQELILETGNGLGPVPTLASAPSAVSYNQWHMVAAAINMTGTNAQLYVDGVAVAGTGSIRPDFGTNQDVQLGQLIAAGFPFNGLIDEARIQSSVSSSNWIWASYITVAKNSSLASYSNVVSTVIAPPLPVAIHVQFSGGSLSLSGTGGTAGGTYYVIGSTNLAVPMGSWTVLSTNLFDASGNFSSSVPVDVSKQALFFGIKE